MSNALGWALDFKEMFQKVGEIISSDVSMTVKVLQLVNSAWFALNRTITELRDAVLMLGTETLKNLVLSAHVFAQLEGSGISTDLVHQIFDPIEDLQHVERCGQHQCAIG